MQSLNQCSRQVSPIFVAGILFFGSPGLLMVSGKDRRCADCHQ